MNVDRVLCGLCVPFDEATVDGRDLTYTRDELRRFVELEFALPVMWDHGPSLVTVERHVAGMVGLVQERVNEIGTAFRFAAVDGGSCPAGVLALAELDETPWCDQLLVDVARREITGLSLRAHVLRDDPEVDAIVWPSELSLTHTPAFESARVIGVGAEALARWELLTGERVTAAAT